MIGHRYLRFILVWAVIGAAIYGVRYYQAVSASQCDNLCKYDNHTAKLNASHFVETVVPRLKAPGQYNLIVFVDPDRDCLACLFETEYWLAPRRLTEDYVVHFFIPAGAPEERVNGYTNQFLLEDDQVIRFDDTGPLSPYHAYGVLKVFYDLDQGIAWFEFGNEGEAEQIALMERIEATIESRAKNR